MKKHLILFLFMLATGMAAQAQVKVGIDFSSTHLWDTQSPRFLHGRLAFSPALKAEVGLGRRLTLTTGFRYATSTQGIRNSGGYYIMCFPGPYWAPEPQVRSFVEVPIGIKYRLNPGTSGKWALSLTGAATVGKALSLTYPVVYFSETGSFVAAPMPWLLGAEVGGEASRSLGQHLTLDFSIKAKAFTSLQDGGNLSIGPQLGIGLGYQF